MLFDTPSFTGWQLEHLETLGRVYRLHRRMLQTFAFADARARPRRWLLKSPGHLSTLPQVFAEYPDARVIHTHRDPRKFIASLVSLLAVLRFTRSDQVDVAALGPMMELTYQMFLEQVIAQRTGTDSRRASSTATPDLADPSLCCTSSSNSVPGTMGYRTGSRAILAGQAERRHAPHTFANRA
jgi:hypothetical protein